MVKKMIKPLIGITCAYDENLERAFLAKAYIDAIENAGGLPVLLAGSQMPERFIGQIDGFLLSGGGDIAPHYFGQERHPKAENIQPERDAFELSLLETVRRLKKPVLGICRGMQLLAVAYGGDLYQDIGEFAPAHILDKDERHCIRLIDGSILSRLFACAYLPVNSSHHQCVRRLGNGQNASAYSLEGFVEAFESDDGTVFGVQWHPERMQGKQAAIFEYFISKCRMD